MSAKTVTATDADTTTAPKTCTFGTPKADLSASGCCGEKKLCEDALRERAYLKWEAAGYPEGDGANFWLEAEAELLAELDA